MAALLHRPTSGICRGAYPDRQPGAL